MRIACIVEGHGEVEAVPILIRRMASDIGIYPDILPPMRVPASKLRKAGELERAVEFAARKCGDGGAILILLDADDDCPAELGPELLFRSVQARADRRIGVVLAKREYEAWFLAATESLAGRRGLPADLASPPDPEAIRDAKGWLADRMGGGSYSETTDQPALTAQFDMNAAGTSDSFDKCRREILKLLAPGAALPESASL